MENYLNVLREYSNFSTRADRREYWMFVLVNMIVSIILAILDQIINPGGSILSVTYTLIILVPALAVTVRRLHDIGKSGWMQLVSIVPLIGPLWLVILLIKEGEKGSNQYGDSLNEERF